MNEIPVKRPRGRPRKNPLPVEREPIKTKWNMRATPNWEQHDPTSVETPDKLHIDPSLIPEGMSLMWVTSQVLGQDVSQHRSIFERGGWTPVHQSDFDGQFDGKFMPKGRDGEITHEGLVLMARPKEITEKAKFLEKKKAYEQVAIKEKALTSGDIPVTLDAGHESAIRTNRINKSYERLEIPE